MAGEWIPYDVCLPQKPEVLELVERTGLPVDQVVGRLVMLWGWASLNSSDGTARISVRLLARVCGGDEVFWQAVQDVGWLEVDAEAGTVGIPGWDARFAKSAKSRALATVRHQVDKAGGAERPRRGRVAPPSGARSARERRDRISSSSPQGAAQPGPEPEPGHDAIQGPQDAPGCHDEASEGPGPHLAGWDTLRAAWRSGKGRPWQLPDPPDRTADRLAEPGWFGKALAAIDHLPRCRFFRDPVTLPQFVGPGFVDKILGGQFDNPRHAAIGAGGDRPPPVAWSGDDAARFEATKRAMIEKLREGAA